ncbi:MAG: diguanylate cyclase, partial [Pyrinomonadaceae bacterium]|nr:diguanylate cyclase [Pyrinomonadaceae bacterium]
MNSLGRLLVFLLIFQFYFCFAECQNLFGQYRFDTWTTDNGLPQNGLRKITQTPDGYLWFTTYDGLVRFDGVRFTTFNKNNTAGIINNRFTWLYGDKDGTLYAMTMEDGILTIYRNGVFSSYTSDQVPGHYIIRIEPDENGEICFLTEDFERTSKSWYYLRNGKFELIEKQENSREKVVYQGKDGTQWTISPTEIIELSNGKTTVHPNKIVKFDTSLPVFEDRENGLWIGGVSLIHLKDGKMEIFGEKDGFLLNVDFHSFRQESDGSIWFANGGRLGPGVGLVKYQNGQFSSYGKELGLSDTSIFDVFKDREGTTWLATNKGLNRLRKKIISGYSTKDGINSSEVYPIYRDRKENIWIGTTNDLSIYRNGKFESANLKQVPQAIPIERQWTNGKMSVQSLFEDSNGKMWIGLNGGIFVSQNGEAEMLDNTAGHHVLAIQSDKSGNVWAATNKGLLRFRDYELIAKYTAEDGLPSEFMTTIFEDSKGRLWFGSYGGLSEFKDGKFINYTTKDGLAGNYVRSIYEDNEGTFWIGTYDEGMSRFKNGQFVSYKEENGLYNSGVFAIREDRRHNFWISSNRGLYRVKRQELNDFADGKINKINSVGYGKEDGMLSTECNGGRQPASITDKDGKFWFPTQEGVIVVDSEAESDNPLPPPVVVEDVTVERESVNFSNGITIEAGQKNIEIRYTGLSLIKSGQIKFQYKLEGHDADWIDAGTRRTAYYSYLPPGNYTFRVKAANSDGVWSEEGKTIGLEMKPFFYQTKSFYLLSIAVGTLCLFLVWQFSVYQLKSRERRLTKLVAERTQKLDEANKELQHLANSDGLTKIGNRRRFENFLADEWHRAVRFKTEISLILLDIDHFKLFNDTYGHQSGDDCLQKVAEALAATINRPTDLVARFGGEEFAIILGGTDAAGALIIAEQALENVKNLRIPHGKSKTSEHLTISLGVA